MTRWIEAVIELLFPRRCPVCDDIVIPRGEYICAPCRKKLQIVAEPCCKKCGKPIEDARQEYCYDCAEHAHVYDSGKAVFLYDETMKRSIARFKYAPYRREYADYYVREMTRCCGRQLIRWKPEALVPVPLHRSRKRRRGYNQAELLADGLSMNFHIPVRTDLVRRIKRTIPQKKLDNKERQKNLKTAFWVSPEAAECETIVLIDDIYTTGSTVDAIAKLLKERGVKRVYILVLSIGHGV